MLDGDKDTELTGARGNFFYLNTLIEFFEFPNVTLFSPLNILIYDAVLSLGSGRMQVSLKLISKYYPGLCCKVQQGVP